MVFRNSFLNGCTKTVNETADLKNEFEGIIKYCRKRKEKSEYNNPVFLVNTFCNFFVNFLNEADGCVLWLKNYSNKPTAESSSGKIIKRYYNHEAEEIEYESSMYHVLLELWTS